VTQVLLQRLEGGRYAVALAGDQSIEETPIRIRRARYTRASTAWGRHQGATVAEYDWVIDFDGRTMLGVIAEWKRRVAGSVKDWDHTLGKHGDGFGTLRDARLKLEEVLGAGSAGHEAPAAHHGGDTGAGERARGEGGG
jgi:hypothetical protein